jgi:hypothetical protein
LREEWICQGREEVLDTFRWRLAERREIDALEFTRAGDQVVLGARGPSITAVEDEPLGGEIFTAFTLRDGRIAPDGPRSARRRRRSDCSSWRAHSPRGSAIAARAASTSCSRPSRRR